MEKKPFRPIKKAAFAAFERFGPAPVMEVVEELGVSRSTIYRWRRVLNPPPPEPELPFEPPETVLVETGLGTMAIIPAPELALTPAEYVAEIKVAEKASIENDKLNSLAAFRQVAIPPSTPSLWRRLWNALWGIA